MPMRTSRILLLLFILVWSCDSDNLFHTLTVVDGAGSGNYLLGEEVTIQANAAPKAGEAFFKWTGDTAFLQSIRSPKTTCKIPFRDVRVEATYRALPTFSLTVENGIGSGSYIAGTKVQITATPPANDAQFVNWTGDTAFLTQTDTFTTFSIIPARNIRVAAVFRASREISFSRSVLPLFQQNCSTGNCHVRGKVEPVLTTYSEISRQSSNIRRVVLNGSMPFDRRMSGYEVDLIVRWIDAGAKNN